MSKGVLTTMILSEAAKPGLQGRAGLALEIRCRKQLAMYFQSLADALNDSGLAEPALLLIHANALLAQASQRLEDILTVNGKAAYLYAGHMSVMQESLVTGAMASAAAMAAAQQKTPEQLDRVGPSAQAAAEYARERAAEAVKDIDATSRTIIQRIVSQGITNQIGVQGVARQLRQSFKDMAGWRAKSIATTEMNTAMSTAAYDKIKSVGLMYKRWIVSIGACPICLGNFSQGAIPTEQAFQSGHMFPPAHPGRCRCSLSGVREERKNDYGPGLVN